MHRLCHADGPVDGQREFEARAAACAGAAPRSLRRGPHDRAADREPQPYARDRALAIAALEFVEQPRRIARRQARDRRRPRSHARNVPSDVADTLRARARPACTWRSCRADSRTPARRASHRRTPVAGLRAICSSIAMLRQPLLAAVRSATPTRSSSDSQSRRNVGLTGLEAHQIEHVGDELRHLARLRFDGLRQVPRAWSRRARRRASRACCPRRRSPRAACAGRARSRRAACCAELSLLRPRRAPPPPAPPGARARARARSARRRFRADATARAAATRRWIARQHREHAEVTPRHRRAADTAPARPAACRTPGPRAARDRPPIARRRDRCRDRNPPTAASRRIAQLAGSIRQQHHGLALENFRHVFHRDARHAAREPRVGGELAAHARTAAPCGVRARRRRGSAGARSP